MDKPVCRNRGHPKVSRRIRPCPSTPLYRGDDRAGPVTIWGWWPMPMPC
jgi:hypothetical protein